MNSGVVAWVKQSRVFARMGSRRMNSAALEKAAFFLVDPRIEFLGWWRAFARMGQ
jgi:hypothetical protein